MERSRVQGSVWNRAKSDGHPFLHIGYLIIIGASVIGVLVFLYKKGCFRRRKILVEEGHRGLELTPGHREVEMSPGDFAHGPQLPEHAPERAYRVLESA